PRIRRALRLRPALRRSSSSGHYADPPMRAADQWEKIEAGLDPDWAEVQVTLVPEGPVTDAAAVLGPLQPGRVGNELRLHVQRTEGGVERARNVFRRLDRRRIWGTLSLVGVVHDVAPEA